MNSHVNKRLFFEMNDVNKELTSGGSSEWSCEASFNPSRFGKPTNHCETNSSVVQVTVATGLTTSYRR